MSIQKDACCHREDGATDSQISITRLRVAARQAVLAGSPVSDCPPEFRFVEHLWRAEYWFADYQITCEDSEE